MADHLAATGLRPDVVVDLWPENTIRITIRGGYTTPSMNAMDRPTALVEVADYFQGQLAQHIGMWPSWNRHDVGGHPELRRGTAVWWCRKGEHVIAPIGEFESTQESTTPGGW